jgi:hypothetical protein
VKDNNENESKENETDKKLIGEGGEVIRLIRGRGNKKGEEKTCLYDVRPRVPVGLLSSCQACFLPGKAQFLPVSSFCKLILYLFS